MLVTYAQLQDHRVYGARHAGRPRPRRLVVPDGAQTPQEHSHPIRAASLHGGRSTSPVKVERNEPVPRQSRGCVRTFFGFCYQPEYRITSVLGRPRFKVTARLYDIPQFTSYIDLG